MRYIWGSRRLSMAIIFLAALSFNNWLLALVFNRPLLFRGGSVSEFGVPTQPYSWVFRSMDILAGTLLIILAIWQAKHARSNAAGFRILVVATTVLGIANAIDGLLPLSCSETMDAGCNIPVSISLTHFAMPHHAYSSIAIGLCYLLLPLAGYVYAGRLKLRFFSLVSAALLATALLSLVSVTREYISKGSFSVHTWGFAQEVQMTLLGLWFISWFFAARADALYTSLLDRLSHRKKLSG